MSGPSPAAAGHGEGDRVGPGRSGGSTAGGGAAGERAVDAARAGVAAAEAERGGPEPGGPGLPFLAKPELGIAAAGTGEGAAGVGAGAGAGRSDLFARGHEVPAADGARQNDRERGAGRLGGEGGAHQSRGGRDLRGVEERLAGVSAPTDGRAAAVPEDQARAGPGAGLGEPRPRAPARPRGGRGAFAPCPAAVGGGRLVHGGAGTRGGEAVRRTGDRRPDAAP